MASDPKATMEAEAVLTQLFDSLQRAGDHWVPGGELNPKGKGYEAIATLRAAIPPDARKAVAEYIKEYIRELGWKASAKVSTSQVRITLSRA